MQRLNEGKAEYVNPWGGQRHSVSLRPHDISGFVFWSRNLAPFLKNFPAIRRHAPFVVQATITGYPRALETSTIAPERAAADLRRIAAGYGDRAVVWRYDPILFSDLTPPDWHVENFSRLAGMVQGAADEVTISFAHIYRKTRRNLDTAAARSRFAWSDPEDEAKRDLVARLVPIAEEHGMSLTVCAQKAYAVEGARLAACIDAARLSDVAGRPIQAKRKGNRPDCLCSDSRDVGAYDTCPHGCAYCYAVQSPALAKRKHAGHNTALPALG